MNLDESRPVGATPTSAELDRQADELVDVYRQLARAAKATVTLSFGKKSGKLRRNSPCPCNSGRKYKVCCMKKVDRGEYWRIDIDGPIDPKSQPVTQLGPSRGVIRYIKLKIAERNAADNVVTADQPDDQLSEQSDKEQLETD
jgi:hypothetical protein